MKPEAYTLYIASTRKGTLRKITVPVYVLHLLAVLAVVGGVTVLAAAGSYTRMLWKVGNYNTLRRQQDTLKRNYQQLQSSAQESNERLNSLAVPGYGSCHDVWFHALPPEPVRRG